MAKPLPPHIREYLESPRPREINPGIVFELLKHHRYAIAGRIKIFRRDFPERAKFLSPEQEVYAAFYGAIKAFLLARCASEVALRFTSTIKGALQLASSAEMDRRREVQKAAAPILAASKALRTEKEMLHKIRTAKTLARKQREYAAAKFTLPRAPSSISMKLRGPLGNYFKFPTFAAIAGDRTHYQNIQQVVSIALKKLASEERAKKRPAFEYMSRDAPPAVEKVVDDFMKKKGIPPSFRKKLLDAAMSRVEAGLLKAQTPGGLERNVHVRAYDAVTYAFKKMQDETSGQPVRPQGRPRKT